MNEGQVSPEATFHGPDSYGLQGENRPFTATAESALKTIAAPVALGPSPLVSALSRRGASVYAPRSMQLGSDDLWQCGATRSLGHG